MAGIEGQVQVNRRPGTARAKMWQSMRILRRFSIPDLCRTSGAGRENAKKFAAALERHGVVRRCASHDGRPGVHNVWQLVRDTGPQYPARCEKCGGPLNGPCRTP